MIKTIIQKYFSSSKQLITSDNFDNIAKDVYKALSVSQVLICEYLNIKYDNTLPSIHFLNTKSKNILGAHSHEKNEILIAPYNFINKKISKEKLMMRMIETLAHELTHHRQYLQNNDSYLNEYVNYVDDRLAYRSQECEKEARFEADMFIKLYRAKLDIIINNI